MYVAYKSYLIYFFSRYDLVNKKWTLENVVIASGNVSQFK